MAQPVWETPAGSLGVVPESIFYQGFSYPTEFSKLDIEIIKMHYN